MSQHPLFNIECDMVVGMVPPSTIPAVVVGSIFDGPAGPAKVAVGAQACDPSSGFHMALIAHMAPGIARQLAERIMTAAKEVEDNAPPVPPVNDPKTQAYDAMVRYFEEHVADGESAAFLEGMLQAVAAVAASHWEPTTALAAKAELLRYFTGALDHAEVLAAKADAEGATVQ